VGADPAVGLTRDARGITAGERIAGGRRRGVDEGIDPTGPTDPTDPTDPTYAAVVAMLTRLTTARSSIRR
jgi:hypothetical protein